MTEDQEFELIEQKAKRARDQEMKLKAWDATQVFVDSMSTTIGGLSIREIFAMGFTEGFLQADASKQKSKPLQIDQS